MVTGMRLPTILSFYQVSFRQRSVLETMLIPLSGSFTEIEHNYPDMVAIDSQGQATGEMMDFCEPRKSQHLLVTNKGQFNGNEGRCATCPKRPK